MMRETTFGQWVELTLLSNVHTKYLKSNNSWLLSRGNCKQVMGEVIRGRQREKNCLKPETPLLSAPVWPENLASPEVPSVAVSPLDSATFAVFVSLPESLLLWCLEASSELLLSFGADDDWSPELEGDPPLSVFVIETLTSSETWVWQNTIRLLLKQRLH